MISMGSFSAGKPYKGRLLEIDKFITLDKRMYDRFQNHYSEISATFTKMIMSLEAPFKTVKLPEIEIPPETEP